MKEDQKIFTPREFIAAYQLPQLVCIHEAHLQQVSENRPRQIRQINQNRLTKENDQLDKSGKNGKPKDKPNDKRNDKPSDKTIEKASDKQAKPSSLLSSLTSTVQQLPKQYLKKGDPKISDQIRPPLPRSNGNSNANSSVASGSNGHLQISTSPTGKSDEDCKDEEAFSDELVEEAYRKRFQMNTLASSDSGNASADSNASSNCSETRYPSSTANCDKCPAANRCEHRVEPNSANSLNDRKSANTIANSIANSSANRPANLSNLIKSSTLNGQKSTKSNRTSQPSLTGEKKLLDLDQPFLLYKSYSSRQVIAHCLDVSSAAQQESLEHFQRTGPSLLIPESYSGI